MRVFKGKTIRTSFYGAQRTRKNSDSSTKDGTGNFVRIDSPFPSYQADIFFWLRTDRPLFLNLSLEWPFIHERVVGGPSKVNLNL